MLRLRAVCALAAMVTGVVAFAFPPATAVAAGPFTVNTTVDAKDTSPGDGQCKTANNQCSLRAAVQEASWLSGSTTINLPAGTYNLNSSDTGDYNIGSKALEIAANVTIVGASAGNTFIVGGAGSNVFNIQRFLRPSEAFTVAMSKLTITGGSAAVGAGVFIGRGVNVSFTDVVIDGNTAAGGGSQGGGIYAWGEPGYPANVTLTRTTVIRNSAVMGGGIVNLYPSVMTIIDSTITLNTARGPYAGGIRNNGNMTLTNTNVTLNTAGIGNTAGAPGGGGIYTGNTPLPDQGQTSSFVMNGGSIVQNSTPTNLLSSGGGIINEKAGTATLNKVLIQGNVSFTGGGVMNDEATMTLNQSTIIGNTGLYGAGLYNNDFAPTNAYPATMTLQRSAVVLNNAIETGCPTVLPRCGAGGGVFSENGQLVLANTTIAENTAATYGAGVYNLRIDTGTRAQAIVKVTNSTIAANVAGLDGGGILNNDGTYQLRNSIVADNRVGASFNDCLLVVGSVTTSLGNNIRSDARCPFTLGSDRMGSAGLAPLANNGGETMTMIPVTGSIAIGAGDNATCAAAPVSGVDQRGVARPLGGVCDIGAVEGEITRPPRQRSDRPVGVRARPRSGHRGSR
ncbi:MAG: choice-of-anchor Q domain-containing protein [Actinomycetota bacterium]|nr:choice-of-anchor Q domain-containing protein [Actinomycetota bacterium]